MDKLPLKDVLRHGKLSAKKRAMKIITMDG